MQARRGAFLTNFRLPGSGFWSYNSWYGMNTYIPCTGMFYNPYGYGIWSPGSVVGVVPTSGTGVTRRPIYGPTHGPTHGPVSLAQRPCWRWQLTDRIRLGSEVERAPHPVTARRRRDMAVLPVTLAVDLQADRRRGWIRRGGSSTAVGGLLGWCIRWFGGSRRFRRGGATSSGATGGGGAASLAKQTRIPRIEGRAGWCSSIRPFSFSWMT